MVRVRLLFVDEGSYHREDIEIPASSLDGYDRLIDCVLEDPAVLRQVHIDFSRLCAVYLAEAES